MHIEKIKDCSLWSRVSGSVDECEGAQDRRFERNVSKSRRVRVSIKM